MKKAAPVREAAFLFSGARKDQRFLRPTAVTRDNSTTMNAMT
jgi:hypothetical protein